MNKPVDTSPHEAGIDLDGVTYAGQARILQDDGRVSIHIAIPLGAPAEADVMRLLSRAYEQANPNPEETHSYSTTAWERNFPMAGGSASCPNHSTRSSSARCAPAKSWLPAWQDHAAWTELRDYLATRAPAVSPRDARLLRFAHALLVTTSAKGVRCEAFPDASSLEARLAQPPPAHAIS